MKKMLILSCCALLSFVMTTESFGKGWGGGGCGGGRPGGGGGTKRAQTAQTFKKAGTDQSLSWNTTVPIKEQPILLYLFDSTKPKGKNFDTSKELEVKIFNSKDVVKLSEQFICEKICFKNELTKSYKGREVLNTFKREYNKTPLNKRETMVVLLDSKGNVLSKITQAKSPGKFMRYMKLALKKTNAKG